MQNKHRIFFLVVGVPTFGEGGGGGGQAGWDKIPSLPKKKFGGLPLALYVVLIYSVKIMIFLDHYFCIIENNQFMMMPGSLQERRTPPM